MRSGRGHSPSWCIPEGCTGKDRVTSKHPGQEGGKALSPLAGGIFAADLWNYPNSPLKPLGRDFIPQFALRNQVCGDVRGDNLLALERQIFQNLILESRVH
jgi:hypothetical protein